MNSGIEDAAADQPEPSDVNLAAYSFELPQESIAQQPAARRDGSRLLVLRRATGEIEHKTFDALPELFRPNDVLVVNDSRVFPARLRLRRLSGGRVELLLLEYLEERGCWRAIGRPGKSLQPGSTLMMTDETTARVVDREADAVLVTFTRGSKALTREETFLLCEQLGEVPLPPYIQRQDDDSRAELDAERYQTVFAQSIGSAAAPTAGLHFSHELIAAIEARGVRVVPVTLHVGLGTFRPLTTETLRGSKLHEESFVLTRAAADCIHDARQQGGRIIAVGTTTCRVLETLGERFHTEGYPPPYSGRTSLFIKPGHRFALVDALVTNFHLPRTSLLVLVSAMAGRQQVLAAYNTAIREGYRFYSYGDAMLVV